MISAIDPALCPDTKSDVITVLDDPAVGHIDRWPCRIQDQHKVGTGIEGGLLSRVDKLGVGQYYCLPNIMDA